MASVLLVKNKGLIRDHQVFGSNIITELGTANSPVFPITTYVGTVIIPMRQTTELRLRHVKELSQVPQLL